MQLTQRILPITLLAVVFGLAVLAMFLQGRPPQLTAAAMLEQTSEDFSNLTSFEYTMTGSQTFESGVVDSGRLVIQMELPDKAYSRQYDADDNLVFETVQVSETRYTRSDGEGSWDSSPQSALLPEGTTSAPASDLVNSVTEFLTGVEVIGNERLNGQAVRHLQGQTNMAAKAALFWPEWDDMPTDQRANLSDARQQFLNGSETVDFWIDSESSRLVRTTVTATYPTAGEEEGYTSVVTIEITRYNESLNITAPASDSQIDPGKKNN